MCLFFDEELPDIEPICFSINHLFNVPMPPGITSFTYYMLYEYYFSYTLNTKISIGNNQFNLFETEDLPGLQDKRLLCSIKDVKRRAPTTTGIIKKKNSKGKRTNKGKGKKNNKGKGKRTNKGKGKSTNKGKVKKKNKGKKNNKVKSRN